MCYTEVREAETPLVPGKANEQASGSSAGGGRAEGSSPAHVSNARLLCPGAPQLFQSPHLITGLCPARLEALPCGYSTACACSHDRSEIYLERYNHVLGCHTQQEGDSKGGEMLHTAETWKRRLCHSQMAERTGEIPTHCMRRGLRQSLETAPETPVETVCCGRVLGVHYLHKEVQQISPWHSDKGSKGTGAGPRLQQVEIEASAHGSEGGRRGPARRSSPRASSQRCFQTGRSRERQTRDPQPECGICCSLLTLGSTVCPTATVLQ